MAELPRYRPLGVSIGSMPSVNFVQTGQAEARVYDQIGNSLDAISDFVYKRAVAEAEVAAVKYGAEIAPSAAELEAASKSGVTIDPDLPDGFTIFDQKARKTAVDVIQTNMEIAARNEINQLTIDAKDSDMSADEFQLNLNAIIDGYSTSLNQIDPVASVNLQAAIAPVANSKLTTHANAMADKAEKQQKVAVTFAVDGIINNIPDIIAAGNKFSQEGNQAPSITTVDDVLNAERNRIAALSYGVEDASFIQTKLKAFDEAVTEGKSNYINGWVRGDGADEITSLDRLGQVLEGNIEDENVRRVADSLTPAQREKAINDGFAVLSEQEKIEESRDKEDEDRRNEMVNAIKIEIADAIVAGDKNAQMAAIEKLKDLDQEEYVAQMEASGITGAYDDPETINALDSLVARGKLTEADILNARKDGLLQNAGTYYTALKSQRDASNRRAMSLIRGYFGIPEINTYSATGGGVSEEARRAMVAAELELQQAVDINPDFDRIRWAKEYIKDMGEGIDRAEGAGQRLNKIMENKINNLLNNFNLTTNDATEAVNMLAQQLEDGEITALEFAEYTSFIAKKGM